MAITSCSASAGACDTQESHFARSQEVAFQQDVNISLSFLMFEVISAVGFLVITSLETTLGVHIHIGIRNSHVLSV